MKKQEFIDLTGEDPEDMFGGDWENEIAELTTEKCVNCMQEGYPEHIKVKPTPKPKVKEK